jgi:FixJ family two-component response regulator
MASEAMSPTTEWVGIVDDDVSIRRALVRAFRSYGIVAMAFSSAEEYLRRNPHEEPCCLVLDVRLGGMNGFELHSRLCADGSPPPIIFMAAMTRDSFVAARADAGRDPASSASRSRLDFSSRSCASFPLAQHTMVR